MKIRIVRQPPGLVYDLPPSIANYLVAEGFAIAVGPQQKSPKAQRIDLRKFREFISEHREGKKMRPA